MEYWGHINHLNNFIMNQLSYQQAASTIGGANSCLGSGGDFLWGMSCAVTIFGGPIGAILGGPTCVGLAIGVAVGGCP